MCWQTVWFWARKKNYSQCDEIDLGLTWLRLGHTNFTKSHLMVCYVTLLWICLVVEPIWFLEMCLSISPNLLWFYMISVNRQAKRLVFAAAAAAVAVCYCYLLPRIFHFMTMHPYVYLYILYILHRMVTMSHECKGCCVLVTIFTTFFLSIY